MDYEDFIKNETECAKDKLHNLLRGAFFRFQNQSTTPFKEDPSLETHFPQLLEPEESTLNFDKKYFAVSGTASGSNANGDQLILYQDNQIIKRKTVTDIKYLAISSLEDLPYLFYGGKYNSLDYLKIDNIIDSSEEKTISFPSNPSNKSAINSITFFEDKLFLSHSSYGVIFLPREYLCTNNNISLNIPGKKYFIHEKKSQSKIVRMCLSQTQLFFSEDEQLYAYSSKNGKTELSHYPYKITSLSPSNLCLYVGCEDGSIHKNDKIFISPDHPSSSAVKKIRLATIDGIEGILYNLHQQPHLFFADAKNKKTKSLFHPLATITDFEYKFNTLFVLNKDKIIISDKKNNETTLSLPENIGGRYICSYGGN